MVQSALSPTLRRAALLCAATIAVGCKMEQKPPATPAAAAAAPHAFTVHAKDFAFTAPDTVPAGLTTITLVNAGPGIHHVQLVRLDSGKTVADVTKAMNGLGPFPAWAHAAGGPNPTTTPGAQTEATVDLAPGSYAIICMVDVPDHVSHYKKGMARALTVTPYTGAAPTLGAADVTITATEYAFTMTDTVKPGMRTFDVKLPGKQPHEVVVFKLDPGKTMRDLAKWGASFQGPPPATVIGGISAIDPGMTARFMANITPGDYVLLCFINDSKDGKPHMMHGMALQFKVT